ncbi:hypothetical protein [Nocardia sp. bgisy118]|uniref:hypothetical protein n=1 Tax=Nocardia sp. bgisy118 TaxID=3413786 RepID=UPI003F4A249C
MTAVTGATVDEATRFTAQLLTGYRRIAAFDLDPHLLGNGPGPPAGSGVRTGQRPAGADTAIVLSRPGLGRKTGCAGAGVV